MPDALLFACLWLAGVSAVTGKICRERKGRDVYVIGAANVGKSAFVRAMLKVRSKHVCSYDNCQGEVHADTLEVSRCGSVLLLSIVGNNCGMMIPLLFLLLLVMIMMMLVMHISPTVAGTIAGTTVCMAAGHGQV